MRLVIKIIGAAVIGSLVRRLITKRVGGPERVEQMMMEVMPKVMDRAFSKLDPAKREKMLANFHAVLAGLDEKYGAHAERTEGPTERADS